MEKQWSRQAGSARMLSHRVGISREARFGLSAPSDIHRGPTWQNKAGKSHLTRERLSRGSKSCFRLSETSDR